MSRPSRVATALLALAVAAGWPASGSGAEIALVKSGEVASWRPAIDALKSAGHQVTEIDLRGSREEAARLLPSLRGRVAMVVAMGPLAAQAARELVPEVPLVYSMVQDPGDAGLLDAPNTAGVAFSVPVRNQLVAFRAVNPRATRIGIVFSTESAGRQAEDARKAASALKLQVVSRRADGLAAIPGLVRELLHGPEAVEALWIVPDPLVLADATRRFILGEALSAGRPVYSSMEALVREGALVSSGPDVTSIGQALAELVSRIARGEKPERMTTLVPRAEVVINKKMADQLGLVIPPEALRAAQRVF